MSCPETPDNCGCLYPSNTNCVVLKGINTNCLSLENGTPLSDALNTILSSVCDSVPPSGVNLVELSQGNGIVITENVVGDTRIYTIGVSSSLINQINNNSSKITTLQGCVQNSVLNITSDTLTVTQTAATACGRTLNLEIAVPTGISLDGIIENDLTKHGANGSSLNQVLKNFSYDLSSAKSGDQVKLQIVGQVGRPEGGLPDNITINLYDKTGSSIVFTFEDNLFISSSPAQKYGFNVEIIIDLETDITNGEADVVINAIWNRNAESNGTEDASGNIPQVRSIFNKSVSNLGFTNFVTKVLTSNYSTLGSSYTFLKKFTAEVRKKI